MRSDVRVKALLTRYDGNPSFAARISSHIVLHGLIRDLLNVLNGTDTDMPKSNGAEFERIESDDSDSSDSEIDISAEDQQFLDR